MNGSISTSSFHLNKHSRPLPIIPSVNHNSSVTGMGLSGGNNGSFLRKSGPSKSNLKGSSFILKSMSNMTRQSSMKRRKSNEPMSALNNSSSNNINNSNGDDNTVHVIQLIIESNWGNTEKVTCSSVDILGINKTPMPVKSINYRSSVANDPNLRKLINGILIKKTEDECWYANWPVTPLSPLMMDTSLTINFQVNGDSENPDSIRIWPNTIEPSANIKNVKIVFNGNQVFSGEISDSFGLIIPLRSEEINSEDEEDDVNISASRSSGGIGMNYISLKEFVEQNGESGNETYQIPGKTNNNYGDGSAMKQRNNNNNTKIKGVRRALSKGSQISDRLKIYDSIGEIPVVKFCTLAIGVIESYGSNNSNSNSSSTANDSSILNGGNISTGVSNSSSNLTNSDLSNIVNQSTLNLNNDQVFGFKAIRLFDLNGRLIDVRKNCVIETINCGVCQSPNIMFLSYSDDNSNGNNNNNYLNEMQFLKWTGRLSKPMSKIVLKFEYPISLGCIQFITLRRTEEDRRTAAKNVIVYADERQIWAGRLKMSKKYSDDSITNSTHAFLVESDELQRNVLECS